MKQVRGGFLNFRISEAKIDTEVIFKGVISSVKETKHVTFALVCFGKDLFQIVLSKDFSSLSVGVSISGKGLVKGAKLSNSWLTSKDKEIEVLEIFKLGESGSYSGIDWSKKELNVSGESMFNERPLSLRHEREKAIFHVQNMIVQTFRNTLEPLGFVEMRTPKISAQGAEGGSNVFSLEYFGKTAFLSQSPQFYKEYGTGIFQKVFEIGPVFRAEKHNTSRHLNEYNSMDLEFGPIESFIEIMELEVLFLSKLMEVLKLNSTREQKILGFTIPEVVEVPSITFREAKEILRGKGAFEESSDFSPSEEKELGKYASEELSSEFLFVTHYPVESRPFYTAKERCPFSGEVMTASFDLLFRGVEITTGGQRIHESEELEQSIKARGLQVSDFEFFLQVHRAGLPPHGGLGLGLERLTSQLVGESSIKRCVLYPRDTTRLSP
jgi:nondiscriminating aspartyl-tRNA synthetase